MLYDVTIHNTGERFTCPTDQSLLAAMEQLRRKGIPIGCRNGGCGVCKVRVLQGSFHTARMSRAVLSDQEQAEVCTLACRTFPLSDMEVEVVGRMAKAVLSNGGVSSNDLPFDFAAMQLNQAENKET